MDAKFVQETGRWLLLSPPALKSSARCDVWSYDQLIALGAFEDEKIELLDGELVAKSPIGTRHRSAVQLLTELLILALHSRAAVHCQAPFAFSDVSIAVSDVLK